MSSNKDYSAGLGRVSAAQSLSYEIAVEHRKENVPPPPKVSDVETLVLSHFTHPPKLDFGSVKVKQMKRCQLNIRNPNDVELDVKIEKFPHKKGFSVESLHFDVDAASTYPLYIDWVPEEPGNIREMVQCHVAGAFRVQAYLLGKCPEPPKPKKPVGKIIKSLQQPVNMIGRPQKGVATRSDPKPAKEVRAGLSAPMRQKSTARAPLQPKLSNKENIRRNRNVQQTAIKPKPSCNDQILSQPMKGNEFDPRMTMRLSKPTILPPVTGNVHLKRETLDQDLHLIETYIEETITTEESIVHDVQTQIHRGKAGCRLNQKNFPGSRPGHDQRDMLPDIPQELVEMKHRETYIAETKSEISVDSQVSDYKTYSCVPLDDDDVYDIEEEIYEEIVERIEETEYVDKEEYVQNVYTMTETPVLSGDLDNRTDTSSSYQISSTSLCTMKDETYTAIKAKHLIQDDHNFTDTPPRRITFIKDDPSLPDTPSRRMTFKKDDPSMPLTPIRRETYMKPQFIKDDPSLPDTPSRRMTFKKDDPSMPLTPIRRETYMKLQSHLSNTPVIGSPDSLDNTNNTPVCLTPSSPRSRLRMGVTSLVTPRRKDTKSVSPPRERHKLRFSDDSEIHKLSSTVDTVDLASSQVHTPLSRYGTYTKLNGSISPLANNVAMLDHSPAATYSVIDDLEDFELPCPVENPQPSSLYKNKRNKQKKLSIISERSEKSERRSIFSTDSLDDHNIETLVSGQSSPTGSKYATAYTTPYESPGLSDEENTDHFEDSMAYLEDASPNATNTTVMENSQLMANILRDKLQIVASFDAGTPSPIQQSGGMGTPSPLAHSFLKDASLADDSIESLITRMAPVPEYDDDDEKECSSEALSQHGDMGHRFSPDLKVSEEECGTDKSGTEEGQYNLPVKCLSSSSQKSTEAANDLMALLKTPGLKCRAPVPTYEDNMSAIEEDDMDRHQMSVCNDKPRPPAACYARSPSMYCNPFNDTGLEVSTLGFENETFLQREKINLKEYGTVLRNNRKRQGKLIFGQHGSNRDESTEINKMLWQKDIDNATAENIEVQNECPHRDSKFPCSPQTNVEEEIKQRCSSTPCRNDSEKKPSHSRDPKDGTGDLDRKFSPHKTPSPIIGRRVSRDTVTKPRASAALVNATDFKSTGSRQAKKGLVYKREESEEMFGEKDDGQSINRRGVSPEKKSQKSNDLLKEEHNFEFLGTAREGQLLEMMDNAACKTTFDPQVRSSLTVTKSKPLSDGHNIVDQERTNTKILSKQLFTGSSENGENQVMNNKQNNNVEKKVCKWQQTGGNNVTYKVDEMSLNGQDEGYKECNNIPMVYDIDMSDLKKRKKDKDDRILQDKGRGGWSLKSRAGPKNSSNKGVTAAHTTKMASKAGKSAAQAGIGKSKVEDKVDTETDSCLLKRNHGQDQPGVRKRFRSEQMSRPKSVASRLSISAVASDKKSSGKPANLRKQAALGSMAKVNPSANTKRAPLQGRVAAKTKLTLIRQPKTNANQALPKHPLAFAAKNVYYDERWMEKEEKGFVKWLNFILTPPDFYFDARKPKKIDAGQLFMTDNQYTLTKAPTKELLSFSAYSVRRRFNRLRRAACRLYQSELFVTVQSKLEREITCGRLSIRTDRLLFADLGLKQKILEMLLSYNPLWLRIGLETIYGEVVHVQSTTDILGLSQFIAHRFLGNPDIAREYAHPTVPHLYRDGYFESLGQFTLKKYLMLVMFLDHAKRSRLILEDPCLFCKDSEFKSSKELLLSFSRDFLAGEGDLVKHLTYMGYKVAHQQTALEEVDYAVTNLATDLRDGIRITRVVSLLTEDWSLLSSLRCPAISILQKVHNVGVALAALTDRKVDLHTARGGKINPREIVDGHREKTLQLLWRIIFNFQVEQVIDKAKLQEEVTFLKKSLSTKKQQEALLCDLDPDALGLVREGRDSVDPSDIYFKSEKLYLLLRWCRAVATHFDIKVENFTVSFSDGRLLCLLLHYYHPELLPRHLIHSDTTLTHQGDTEAAGADSSILSDDSFGPMSYADVNSPLYEKLLKNEKENFKTLYEKVTELGGVPLMLRSTDMSATIPDEKVVITYVSYLCARLLDIRHECRAARIIQHAWRKYRISKFKGALKDRHVAARIIQRAVRPFLERSKNHKQCCAATVLQRYYLGYKSRQLLKALKEEVDLNRQRDRVVVIQACVRGYLLRQQLRERHRRATVLQSAYKGWRQRTVYRKLRQAVTNIQAHWKANRLCHAEVEKFAVAKSAAIKLQFAIRRWLRIRCLLKHSAATKIKAFFRMVRIRREYQRQHCSTIVLQSHTRKWLNRSRYCRLCAAVRIIQAHYRARRQGKIQQERYAQLRTACLCIQTYTRGYLARRRVRQQKAAVKIQATMRGYVERQQFVEIKHAVLVIQRCYRAEMLKREVVKEYSKTKKYIVMVQACVRGYLVRKQKKTSNSAAVVIQRWYRGYKERSTLKHMEESTRTIQRYFRGFLEMKRDRKKYQESIRAVVLLQSWTRMCSVKRKFLRLREVVIRMQALVRMKKVAREYQVRKNAAVVIQRYIRGQLLAKATRATFERSRNAAITLQSYVRMWRQRKSYSRTKTIIVAIQSLVRRNLARKAYLKKRQAVITIQRFYRSCLQAKSTRESFMQARNAAITLQSSVRMWRQRKIYWRTKTIIVKMQSLVRGNLARKACLQKRQAIVTIQRSYRNYVQAKSTRESFMHLRKAAITVQSCIRMWIHRASYLHTKSAAIKMQSLVRAVSARNKYLEKRRAVVKLQRCYRGFRQMKQVRGEYVQAVRDVVVVQSSVRRYLALVKYRAVRAGVVCLQSSVRRRLAVKRYTRTVQALNLLQDKFRAHLAMKRQRQTYEHMRRTVVKLQSLVRMKQRRKVYLKQRKAIVCVQSMIRGKQERARYRRKQSAALCIQRVWRAHYIAIVNELMDQRVKIAVVSIQAVVRGYLTRKRLQRMTRGFVRLQALVRRKQLERQFLKFRYVAYVIQDWWRATLKARDQRQKFCVMKQGVVCLQATFKARKAQREFVSMKHGFIKLQALWRMRREEREFQKMKTAVGVIQRRLRATLQARVQRSMYLHYRWCTTVLQTAVRGYYQRKQFIAMKNGFIKLQALCRMKIQQSQFTKSKMAAIVIQRRWRANKHRDICLQDFESTRHAVVRIQAMFKASRECRRYQTLRTGVTRLQALVRGVLQRKALLRWKAAVIVTQYRVRAVLLARKQRAEYLTMRASVLCIQNCYRCFVARRRYATMKEGFTKLQALYKSRLLRRRFELMKTSATRIQQCWRATLLKMGAERRYKVTREAVITVQSAIRRFSARKRFQTVKTGMVKLQALQRCRSDRRTFVSYRNAALVIQRRWRALCVGTRERDRYVCTRMAVVCVQSVVRGYIQRRKYLFLRNSVMKVQACWKGVCERKRYTKIKSSVACLQSRWRATLACRKAKLSYKTQLIAVKRIQNWYRKILQQRLIVRTEAVVRLQSYWRGYRQRIAYGKILTERALRKQAATVILQHHILRYVARQRALKVLRHKVCCVIRLQALVRGYQARQRMRKLKAAVCVQAAVRGFLVRRRTVKLRSDIVKCQSQVRMWLCRSRFTRLKRAAVIFRAHWRAKTLGRGVRDDLAARHHKATVVQAFYRKYRAQQKYIRMRTGFVKLQRLTRRFLYCKHYERVLASAVSIQRWWRSVKRTHVIRSEYVRKVHSTRTLQRHVRRYLVKKHVLSRAAVQVQAAWRGYILRSRLDKLSTVVVEVQRRFRQNRQKIREKRRAAAVLKIQSVMRGYLARRRFVKLQRAVLLAQSLWRGRQQRLSLKDARISKARLRVQRATNKATEERTLASRTISALDFLLKCKNLGTILGALIDLDVVTKLLPECCERLVEANAVHVLYKVILGSNRSVPHQELIKYAVSTLLNLAKYDKTALAVYNGIDSINLLVDMMSIYRDKKGLLFSQLCTLLGIIGHIPQVLQDIQEIPRFSEKLRSIQTLVARKNKMEVSRQKTAARMAAMKSFNCTLPLIAPSMRKRARVKPEWVLKKGSMSLIKDPLEAIDFVLETFSITPK